MFSSLAMLTRVRSNTVERSTELADEPSIRLLIRENRIPASCWRGFTCPHKSDLRQISLAAVVRLLGELRRLRGNAQGVRSYDQIRQRLSELSLE